jgi:serine/threonine protein kinase
MHSQGVVHRDIKADNILLAHAGEGAIHIKVADFGVAVVLATVSGSAGLLSRSPGTHQYFAPERGKSQKYGRMADMWAVGCVIIELLTRERLREALWDDGVEVSGRREQLIGLVECEHKDLGAIVRDLLHPDKNFRLNALILKSRLSAQKNIIDAKELVSLQKSGFPDTVQLQQVCDAEEEVLRAKALQEAEDARFARALQEERAAKAAAAAAEEARRVIV